MCVFVGMHGKIIFCVVYEIMRIFSATEYHVCGHITSYESKGSLKNNLPMIDSFDSFNSM